MLDNGSQLHAVVIFVTVNFILKIIFFEQNKRDFYTYFAIMKTAVKRCFLLL